MVPVIATIDPIDVELLEGARRRLAPVEEAIAQLQSEAESAEERRTLCENRHVGGRNHQCGGCSKFLRAINEDCERCGFHNDIRGRRNLGGYR
jgi:predicted PP-loop superfamily ATPase